MRRLTDGAFAVVAGAPRDSHVASIAHPRVVALDAVHMAELRELAHGMPTTMPPAMLMPNPMTIRSPR